MDLHGKKNWPLRDAFEDYFKQTYGSTAPENRGAVMDAFMGGALIMLKLSQRDGKSLEQAQADFRQAGEEIQLFLMTKQGGEAHRSTQ